MYFRNPEVIKTEHDATIGGVRVFGNPEINFLTFIDKIEINLAVLIKRDIDELASTGMSREDALKAVASKVYSQLSNYELRNVISEEDLALLICESRNFEGWKRKIWLRFKNIHVGKVEVDTYVAVGGEDSMSDSEIARLQEEATLDSVLEILSMELDLGTSRVN